MTDIHLFKKVVSQAFRLTVAAMKGDSDTINCEFENILDTVIHMIENRSTVSKETETNLTDAFLTKDVLPDPPTLHIYPNTNVLVEKVNKESDKEVHLVYTAVPPNVVIYDESDNETDQISASQTETQSVVETNCKVEKVDGEVLNEARTAGTVVNRGVVWDAATMDELVRQTVAQAETVRKREAVAAATGAKKNYEGEEKAEEEEAEEEECEEAEEEEVEEEEAEEAEEEEVEEEEVEEEEEEGEEGEEEESMEVTKIGKKQYFVGETSKLVYVFLNEEEAGECLGKYENGKIVTK